MLSVRHLFELGQQVYDAMGKYINIQRDEFGKSQQTGNKPAKVQAAQRIQRALDVRYKLANRGN